ncbi:aminotransferase class IV [Mesoterricola silvestris]|uniref:branched-chain-amino-acid transaminase n=1 Tax=Mesoterricola silvestris TaxID=2927979 RepID=A0AA48GXM4_9BACT|nr:aminotransferase class IV [Mesoterricola silvestris]BDU73756.1 branched chain amino acid--2-keto-4-methylthiobutyrate aminotransferase [Mesoterricola silvestris]
MLELVTDTNVDLAGSALRFGAGLFETIRVQGGRARWLPWHLERLAAGCAFLGLGAPPPDLEGRLELPPEGVLRLLAADGRLLAWTGPLEPAPPRGLRLGLSREILRHPGPLTRFKTTSYLENHLLQAEARARGLDEVLAPTPEGRLSDGGRSTLVAVLDGALLTPPLEDGALPGIGRRVLLEAGLVREAPLTWEDLARARALALVSALRGLRPVAEAGGRILAPDPAALRGAAEALSW